MERIIIIGCGGAGKSTLARQLGEITGLPVVHLDQIWWSPGNWQHISREEFDAVLELETVKDRWVLDGNYSRTLPRHLEKCDTVIYLDFNRIVCLFSWIGRVIKNRGKARADMAPGCAEWFDPEMAGWIWNYNKLNRNKNYMLLSRAEQARVIVLKNRRQVRLFLKSLK